MFKNGWFCTFLPLQKGVMPNLEYLSRSTSCARHCQKRTLRMKNAKTQQKQFRQHITTRYNQ